MSLGQLLLDGKALPGATRPVRVDKPDRWVAKDARTDQGMVQVLFQTVDLISQYRQWQRAARALDEKFEDPALAEHPKRAAAVTRWEQAVDRCARIELSLWELAPAAASGWLAYSPARRAEHALGGRWPPVAASFDDAVGWFRDDWLAIAHEGSR